MQPDEVRSCIEKYRDCAARCAFLEREIKDLEIRLTHLLETQVEDAISITQQLTGMPHATGVGDPTGKLAQKMADGFKPDYIRELEHEIAEKKEELRTKSSVVIYVDSWMKCLSERERYVIMRQCIDGAYWRDVVAGFQEKFGDVYSPQGLKKIRTRAMNKIYEIAK